jgi:hypothetical protein
MCLSLKLLLLTIISAFISGVLSYKKASVEKDTGPCKDCLPSNEYTNEQFHTFFQSQYDKYSDVLDLRYSDSTGFYAVTRRPNIEMGSRLIKTPIRYILSACKLFIFYRDLI